MIRTVANGFCTLLTQGSKLRHAFLVAHYQAATSADKILTLHVKRRTDCSIAAGRHSQVPSGFHSSLRALPMNRDGLLAIASE